MMKVLRADSTKREFHMLGPYYIGVILHTWGQILSLSERNTTAILRKKILSVLQGRVIPVSNLKNIDS